MVKYANYFANRGSNIQCSFPTTGQCTISLFVSAVLGRGRFGTVSFIWNALLTERYTEGNVLFNDALNTFYLRLYGVRHMVKDHSDSEKGNPPAPHRLLFPINSKNYFICTIPHTGSYIPRPLIHQSRSTGWNEKYRNGSTPWRNRIRAVFCVIGEFLLTLILFCC